MTTSIPFRPDPLRAGDGNRTHVACLEGRYSTIELHPRAQHQQGSSGIGPNRQGQEFVSGFEEKYVKLS